MIFSLIAAGLITLLCFSGKDGQLTVTRSSFHVAIRYVPSVIGTITTLITRSIINDFLRLMPFVLMTREAPSINSLAVEYWPNFGLFNVFRSGHTWFTRTAVSVLILSNFLTAFKVGLFIVAPVGDVWVIYVTRVFVILLITSYSILAVFIFTLGIYFATRRATGLRWDITTIADIASLFHRSTAVGVFAYVSKHHNSSARRTQRDVKFQLGYWADSRSWPMKYSDIDAKLSYGVQTTKSSPAYDRALAATLGQCLIVQNNSKGTAHPSNEQNNVEESSLLLDRTHSNKAASIVSAYSEAAAKNDSNTAEDFPAKNCQTSLAIAAQQQGNELYSSAKDTPFHFPSKVTHSFNAFERHVDNRWPATHLLFVFYTMCLGVGLSLCAIAYHRKLPQSGFTLTNFLYNGTSPDNTTGILSNSTESYNSTYPYAILHDGFNNHTDLWVYILALRAIPTAVASSYGITYLTFVLNRHAFNKPLYEMYRRAVPAEKSIQLEYYTGSPLNNAKQALESEHWFILYLSVLQMASSWFPIAVGAIISTAANDGARVHFNLSPEAIGATLGFIVIYILTTPFIRPHRHHMLVHPRWNISHLMSLCWASHFLHTPEFDIADKRTTKRHFISRVFITDRLYRYGTYRGVDGNLYEGFDQVGDRKELRGEVYAWEGSDKPSTAQRLIVEPIKRFFQKQNACTKTDEPMKID